MGGDVAMFKLVHTNKAEIHFTDGGYHLVFCQILKRSKLLSTPHGHLWIVSKFGFF